MPSPLNRERFSWCLYDWANSAFATTVMAGFFPVFFKQYWALDMAVTDSTFFLGLANSVASLVIVLFAPLLGAMADHLSARKRFLSGFALLGILMSAGLFFIAQGDWVLALVLYTLAILGFSGSNIFYDSLLMDVSSEKSVDTISSIGFSMGYLGGGILFLINVVMVTQPRFFGLSDSAEAVRWAFVSVACWWAVFSIPLLIFVEEKKPEQEVVKLHYLKASFLSLRDTLKRVVSLKMTFLFLLAYWFYIDGVDTIIRMAVDYGLSLGLEANDLLLALLITQFVGFPAALLFAWIGHKKGVKTGISISLFVYCLIVLWAYNMTLTREFYILAIAVGLVQGGIQALSRSLYSRLVPEKQKAAFFGFYNMLGKFAAVIGPMLVGMTAMLTGDPRQGILSVLILFLLGGYFLYRVDIERGQQDAAAFRVK